MKNFLLNPVYGILLLFIGGFITGFAGPTFEWFGPDWSFLNYLGFGITAVGILQITIWALFAKKK